MYEHSSARLAPRQVYKQRLLKAIFVFFIILLFSLFIGILGYHYLANLGWVDSFLNASMILGGMGPVDVLTSKTAKIFAGCYAIFCGISFLIGMGVILTPMLHRFLHKFHWEEDDSPQE